METPPATTPMQPVYTCLQQGSGGGGRGGREGDECRGKESQAPGKLVCNACLEAVLVA